jgi:hypothetical protein
VPSVTDFADSFDQNVLRVHLDASLERLPVEMIADARQLFDRLTPAHWPVEWHLPWWLGQDFALDWRDVQALTLCNLLGLGYVRLHDAILDEPATAAERRRRRSLADALRDQAFRRLHDLFGEHVAFQEWMDTALRQWQQALTEGEQAPARRFADWTGADLSLLAWRGAPIKITAVGACLLAGADNSIPTLDAALDHMLIAQVLMDHLDDWPADLEHARFNAFVAFTSDLSQTTSNREANRRRVLDEFFVGTAGAGYVDLARTHLGLAREGAAAVPCSGLARYLDGYDRETALSHELLHRQIGGWLRAAAAEVLARRRRRFLQLSPLKIRTKEN